MEEKDTIDKRRLTEKNLYVELTDKLIIRRNPMKKQQKVKISNAEYTFLQFHSIIWTWAIKNNNITTPQLNMLLYIAPLVTFTTEEFTQAQRELGNTTRTMFYDLKRNGFIITWSKAHTKHYYTLTTKGVKLISRLHKMYMLEEEIPMSPRRNVIARTKKRKDVEMMKLFKKFNNKIKEKKEET